MIEDVKCNCGAQLLVAPFAVDSFTAVMGTEVGKSVVEFAEVHQVRWCAVVNSMGGMFQLQRGEQ